MCTDRGGTPNYTNEIVKNQHLFDKEIRNVKALKKNPDEVIVPSDGDNAVTSRDNNYQELKRFVSREET